MVRQYHWLNGHEFKWTPRDREGQGSLVSCRPWGCKESDRTEQLNSNWVTSKPRHMYCFSILCKGLFDPMSRKGRLRTQTTQPNWHQLNLQTFLYPLPTAGRVREGRSTGKGTGPLLATQFLPAPRWAVGCLIWSLEFLSKPRGCFQGPLGLSESVWPSAMENQTGHEGILKNKMKGERKGVRESWKGRGEGGLREDLHSPGCLSAHVVSIKVSAEPCSSDGKITCWSVKE